MICSFLLRRIVELATAYNRVFAILCTVNRLILIFNLVVFIFSTEIFYLFTRKYLSTGKLRYLLTVLWIPYFAIFTYIFSSLFPIRNPGDDPAPVLGLIIIGIFLIYPFYIVLINAISFKTEDN